MSFRKPCHMPFRKLIPPLTLTGSRSLLVMNNVVVKDYHASANFMILSGLNSYLSVLAWFIFLILLCESNVI